jgi:type II secretory pathway component HofQ
LSLISGPGSNANLGNLIANTAANFIARLRFLEQQGDASIQARPSILTTENVGAIIDLSETVYIQTTSERTALVTPVTAGTTLRVTPRVVVGGEDPVVRLTVDLEDGQIQNPTAVGALPSVRRGTVSTEAAVRREESLLLGGYNSVQAIKGRDAVPGLGDLPVISPLFSNTQQQVQRRERLFLIRSRVVGSLPAVADAATPATAAAAVVKPVAVPPPAPLTPTAVESSPVIAPGEGLGPAPLPLTPTTPVGQTPVPQALPPAAARVPAPVPEVAPRPSTRAENARQREQESIRALEAALDRAEKSLQYYRERLSTGFNAASQDERDARSITRAVAERARAEVELLRSEIASRRAREPAPN